MMDTAQYYGLTADGHILCDNGKHESNSFIEYQYLDESFDEFYNRIEEKMENLISENKNLTEKGHALDQLIDDLNENVRAAVAVQGYGLDKLIDDPSWKVRAEVAKQGYGLEKLVNDPNKYVRYTVAGQGYGIDKLIDDPDFNVRDMVEEYLRDNLLTIEEYNQKVEETGGYDWVKDLSLK